MPAERGAALRAVCEAATSAPGAAGLLCTYTGSSAFFKLRTSSSGEWAGSECLGGKCCYLAPISWVVSVKYK